MKEIGILCYIVLLILIIYDFIEKIKLSVGNLNLQQRIDKAIEYIEKLRESFSDDLQSDFINIIDILKGIKKD